MRALVFSILFSVGLLANGASNAITLDFDGGTDGVAVGADFAGLGVNFSNAEYIDIGLTPGTMFGIVSEANAGQPPPGNPIVATFDAGVFTDGIAQITIDAIGVGLNGVLVEAFDETNTLVDSFSTFGTEDDISITLTAGTLSAGRIFRLELSLIDETISILDGIVFDNLFFTVPEPATLAMLGLGAFGVLRLRRRKQ